MGNPPWGSSQHNTNGQFVADSQMGQPNRNSQIGQQKFSNSQMGQNKFLKLQIPCCLGMSNMPKEIEGILYATGTEYQICNNCEIAVRHLRFPI